MLILVDKNDTILGYMEKEEAHTLDGKLHRAISVCVFNNSEKLLIQKRSQRKKTWPKYWSNTCCSHPVKNESYHDAAMRCLKEELGVVCELKHIYTFSYQAVYNNRYKEHEMDAVFIGKYNGDITPNANEVIDYKWIGKKRLLLELKGNPDKFTPWFGMIVPELVKRNVW